MRTTELKRIVTLLLVAAVCFAMLFSVCFIAAETDHDCAGEGCVICARLDACENMLTAVSLAAVTLAAFAAVTRFAIHIPATALNELDGRTLISLKVELLN